MHSARLRAALLGLLLVAAVLLAYQPAWRAGFIWDDDDYVTHNRLLTAPDGLARIWFSTDSPSQYFPLVYTSFRLQHALWGLDPAGYHWVNLLLHAANALLVWRLLSRLAIPGAWLAAAVFALHPLQVESVAWITELKNVQSLFFSLLAVLAWLRFTERDEARDPSALGSSLPAPRSLLPYAAALACHALALFSKTTACTLPAALVLVLWIRRRPLTLARWLQIAPFVLLGLALGLVSVWWERHQQGTVGSDFHYGVLDRLLIAGRALSFYLGKFLWPENLTFSYPLWIIDARSPAAWAWFLPLAALAAAVLALRRRLGRGPEAGLVFFAATLLPLLGVFMLYTFRYTFVADHYVYVALIGLAALVGAGSARLASRIRSVNTALPAVLSAGLLLGLATLSWRQARMYENRETLWTATLARNPSSFMAANNLGAIRLEQNRLDEAEVLFRRSLALKPDHVNALSNLGQALLRIGRLDEAFVPLRHALALQPADAKAHADLGNALLETGRLDEALPLLRQSLALDPLLAEGHNALGVALLRAGRPPAEAAACFARAVELYPEFAEALYNLATLRLAEGELEPALPLLHAALRHAPGHAKARRNLALALLLSGRPADAAAQFRALADQFPADADVRVELGRALLENGEAPAALAALEEALRLDANHVPALASLAWTLSTWPEDALRDGPRALALARRAAALADGNDPFVLRVLAAACAESGRFAEAAALVETALRLASASSDDALRADLSAQLALHRAGRALRGPAPSPPPASSS